MATLTIRDLDDAVLERLRQAAKAHNRSLAGEVREALTAYVAEPVFDQASWLREVDALADRARASGGQVTVQDLRDAMREDWDPQRRRD